MNIVKWLVSTWSAAPERKEYDKETECFYIYTSGRMKTARRDAKSSTYYRYFDSEAEAMEFIRQRDENKADQKRVDKINRCGVELLDALESLVLFTHPKPSNAVVLNRAYQVIAKARG